MILDRLGASDAPLAVFAEWRLVSPPGTTIARAQLWRSAGKASNTWELYARVADGTKLSDSDCTRQPSQFTCQLGGPGSASVDWPNLSTSSVGVGIACTNTSTTCAPGATLHEAWTAIYRSIVTIDDPTPPTASGATGTLFAPGYVRGNVAATLASAADGSGIRTVQVRVDGGRVVGETQLPCDFTRSRPCEDVVAPVSVPVVAANIGDGVHTAELGVVDAGGNFTPATTRTITVDDTAPASPAATSPVLTTTAADRATISWAEPPQQVSALTAAYVTVCSNLACRTTTQPAGLGAGAATIALADGPGTYRVSVAHADAAGNHDPNRAAHWSITRTAASTTTDAPSNQPTAPARPTAVRLVLARPTVARDRRTITIRGTVAPTARGRVRLTVRARIGGRLRTQTKHATVARGRYTTTLRLPSRRWRTATITARHGTTTTTRTVRNR